jgi:hypothetical protein
MRLQRFVPLATLLLAAPLALLAARPAASQIFFPIPWVILGHGNPGTETAVGTVIYTESFLSGVVKPTDNPLTGADGTIVNGLECPHGQHYHGVLNNASDDHTKCGWGAVTPLVSEVSPLPVPVSDVALAIEAEIDAIRLLQQTPPDYQGALDALDDAFDELAEAGITVTEHRKSGAIDKKAGGKALKGLKDALHDDNGAHKLIAKLKAGKGKPGQLTAAILKISNALKDKRKAFAELVNGYELLVEGE